MSRVLAHCVPREMALLGLVELTLSTLLIYVVLNGADLPGGLSSAAPGFSWGGVDLAATIALLIVVTAATAGLYRTDICLNPRRVLITATVAGVIASPFILWLGGLSGSRLGGNSLVWVAQVLGVWVAVLVVTRLAYSLIARHSQMTRRVLVIGTGTRGAHLMDVLRLRHVQLFEPVKFGADYTTLSATSMRRQRIWGVIVADDAIEAQIAAPLLDSKLRGIKVFSDADFHEQHLGRIDLDTIDTGWLLRADGFGTGCLSSAVKRAFDILSSSVLVVATLPLMLITALLIKLDTPGPVLYRQRRTGHFGVPFTLFKFRSMTVDAEAGGQPRWAQKHDPRVTRVGHFIRQTRVDELPQLFNVLRGDMSMIGPRPERPHFVEELSLAIPYYREREYVKPGITGWAQVNYPYGASVEDAREKLSYDLYYVKNRSLPLDFLIFCSTVRVVLFREGAR